MPDISKKVWETSLFHIKLVSGLLILVEALIEIRRGKGWRKKNYLQMAKWSERITHLDFYTGRSYQINTEAKLCFSELAPMEN